MNNHLNGNHPGGAPLKLSDAERAALLKRAGISSGWVLLSVSEMFNLKKQMDSCQRENERLNKQTSRILAAQIVHAAVAEKALSSARATFAILAEQGGNFAFRADAMREVAHIDEALSVLPTPKPPEPEKKEGEPRG